MKLLLCLLLAWCTTAQGRCAPTEDRVGVFGEIVAFHALDPSTGPLMLWECWRIVDESGQPAQKGQWRRYSVHCIADSWARVTARMLGDRAETVRAAADPVAAFHASYARHVKNTDPVQIERCLAVGAEYAAWLRGGSAPVSHLHPGAVVLLMRAVE